MSVVLITGANSGIGMAAAMGFARTGHTVYAGVRTASRGGELRAAAEREGLDIRVIALDVTRSDTFERVIEEILTASGRLDVLINNAGILRPGSWEELPEAEIRLVMETNFFGAMLLTRAVLPAMRRAGGGMIIMVSSLSGVAGLAGDVAYSASKFALEGATESLRHEVDRWGIKVALVLGGQYATGLFGDATLEKAESDSTDGPAQPYAELVSYKIMQNKRSLASAFPPERMAELMLEIAGSDGSQLRWPADDVAEMVLSSMHAQADEERDEFLKMAGGTAWWSQGETPPKDT